MTTCENCGGGTFRQAALGELAWEWLQGGRQVRRRRTRCESCGSPVAAGWSVLVGGPPRLWHAPRRIGRALLSRRPVELSPLFLLGTGVLGGALGLLVRPRTRLPWWAFAPATAALSWLAPVVRGLVAPSGRRSLRLELLDAVHPNGAHERWMRETARAFSAEGVPAYAVTDRPGSHRLGGSGYAGARLDTLELTYSPVRGQPDAPQVRVETVLRDSGPRRAGLLWQLAALGPPDAPVAWDRISAREGELSTRPWQVDTLDVDGAAVPFEVLHEGAGWVAVGQVGPLVLRLTGDRYPFSEVALRGVWDLEPYVQEALRLAELQQRAAAGIRTLTR